MSSSALITADAAQYTDEQRRLITDVLCKGASPIEVEFFMQVAQRCKLDPFRRQIHAVKRWDSQANREVMTFQVGIDGLRAIAARTKAYAGNDDPVFVVEADNWYPTKATVTVYRMVQGQRIPFTASVYWAEYVQVKRGGEVTSMWRQRPFGQLGKCAEAAALRKAFPEDTSGLYTEEELRDDTGFHQPATQQEQPVYHELSLKPREAQTPAPQPQPQPQPPAAEAEAEVIPAHTARPTQPQHSSDLLDLLTLIQETADPQELRSHIGTARALPLKAETDLAERSIMGRAKALKLTWDKQSATFITA